MKTHEEIYNEARKAGLKAGQESIPDPMIVDEHVNQLDDSSAVKKSWYVSEGICGFAWINIKPGNCTFAKWLKNKNLARKDSYYGGVTIWVNEFGQSATRKKAYASAFSSVLDKYDITSYAMSRLD